MRLNLWHLFSIEVEIGEKLCDSKPLSVQRARRALRRGFEGP